MANTKTEIEFSDCIRMLFPDDNEREILVGCALTKLSAKAKPTKRGKLQVVLADVVCEMLRVRRMRSLMQLVIAMEPKQGGHLESLLGDARWISAPELAYAFGVSEATIRNDWIPAGMPCPVQGEREIGDLTKG